MKFLPTPLEGAFVVEQEPFSDDRGFFARAFCKAEFSEAGIDLDFVQMNMSGNSRAGTLRGLHYQDETAPEAKFLRCVRGRIFDAIVDMRIGSVTYGQWFGVTLTAEDRRAIFVPPLFAHGYMSLEDDSQVMYQTSAYYAPGTERGVRFDDPGVGIKWPMAPADISEKDKTWPDISLK
ncbi:MAG: dTDP-4-dehydrorhamnose 3,5-epimerase [Pseudomonadota bacterium]